MKQHGRKSAASQDAGSVVDISVATRPRAPEYLSDRARALFTDIVRERPAEYFDAASVPLLIEYCQIPDETHVVSEAIRVFEADWLSEDGGIRRLKELVGMRDKAQKRMAMLATKMRLAQQSRYVPDSAKSRPKPEGGTGPKPWEK